MNAGDGTHQHPTQALLDAATLRHRFSPDSRGGDLSGLHVAIVGDIAHSRVARSNVSLLTTLGARVTVVGPAELMPSGVEDWPVEVRSDLDAVIEGAPDALMMLRIQRERIKGEHQPASGDYVRNYCLTTERADRLPSHALVMHPGPMNRGVEIASDVADSPRSVVLEQVRQGVAVRMAVLFNLWGGEK